MRFNWAVASDQIVALAISNMKGRYRNTVAGFIWVVLSPLVIYGVQSLVFNRFLKLQIANYSLFLVTGLLPWIFVSQSLEMNTSLFVSLSRVLKSFQVHPLVFVAAQILDNFFNFAAAFISILTIFLLSGSHQIEGLGFLLLPLPAVIMMTGVFAMSWALATLQVFFRDTRFLVSFVLNITFFLTPVFYPPEYVPEHLRWCVEWNPFFRLIDPFRQCLYRFESAKFWASIAMAAMTATVLMTGAAILWRWKRNSVYVQL